MVDATELIEHLTQDIASYVMAGKKHLLPNAVFEHFSYDGLEKYNLEELILIHFIIQEDIIEFVDRLPRWLRSIKRKITRRTVEGREVRGHIQWGKTYEARYAQNYKDRSLFVRADPEKEYNIPENLLLKRFLTILYKSVEEILEEYLGKGYEWVTEWEEQEREKGLAHQLKRIFERNVHLSRIKAVEDIDVRPRAVQKSRQSRKPLYREAARHYMDYQQYQRGNEAKLRELLEDTAILPEKTWRLFEIYFLLRLIRAIQDLSAVDVEQKLVKEDMEWTARFGNGHRELRVYYNRTPAAVDITEPTGKRRYMVNEMYGDTLERYFGARRYSYTMRPDAMVEVREAGELKDLLIFEVKYSSRKETIFTGVKELSEYPCFLQEKAQGKYVFENRGDMLNRAALIIEAFPRERAPLPIDQSGEITLLSYEDIEERDKLTKFLRASSIF